jgi:hypothetical protein
MKIRELFESMDGVSPGTHMFTSEETRGSARTFGAEAMAGIKNKERILRAASFVTKQRNHPQNQARLVRRNPDSQRGYEEVVTLSVEDTKLWAKKLQDFFRNPANNIKHKELYYLLSDPTDSTKIQGLVNLISNQQSMAEALGPDTDPPIQKKTVYMVVRVSDGQRVGYYENPADAQQAVKELNNKFKDDTHLIKKSMIPVSQFREDQINEKRKKRKKPRRSVRGPVFYGGYGIFTGDSGEGEGGGVEESQLDEKWSEKYKRSINCSNPKGFSQRAHCQGRKKSSSKKPVGEAAVGSITSGQLEVLIDEHALDRARERGVDPAAVDYIIKKQMPEVLSKLSQLASGEKFWVYDWSRETALGLRRISSSELKFVLKTVWPGKPAQTPTVTKIIRT